MEILTPPVRKKFVGKNQTDGSRSVLAALRLCLALVFLSVFLTGALRPALAQNPGPWYVDQTTPSFSNGNSYVLWVKSGTTSAAGAYSGDMVSIWTMDVTGHRMAISPTYGPYAGWRASDGD